jgi:hypothetical protein
MAQFLLVSETCNEGLVVLSGPSRGRGHCFKSRGGAKVRSDAGKLEPFHQLFSVVLWFVFPGINRYVDMEARNGGDGFLMETFLGDATIMGSCKSALETDVR